MILNYNETAIYYTLQGKGPALVLLHGFLESSTMWDDFILKIGNKNTVITIDLPGHGKSGCIGEVHSMELMAEVVHAVLEKHRILSAEFIGHSMGGYVVLAFTELYINRVHKIVLLNSTVAEDSKERKINRDRALKVIAQNPKAFISMAISNLFTESSQEKYAIEINKLKKDALTFPIQGITAAILGMRNRKDRSLVLKEFQEKKIMICGIEDLLISYEVSKNEALQTGTAIKSVSGGHMSLVENLDEIIKIYTLS
jgi:pimeloyl-ACP methyl ester carboxylesterase